MKLRKQGHCAYQCEYHLVFVSKYRRKIFNAGSFSYFKDVLKQAKEGIPEIVVLTFNHDIDHVHLHISILPKMSVSSVVQRLKSITGRLMKKKFEYIQKAYCDSQGVWSYGYFVSTIGINEKIIEHQRGLNSDFSTINALIGRIVNESKQSRKRLLMVMRRFGSDQLSRSLSRSIIGAERFHCRVRDGIECCTFAITTKPSHNH